MNEESQLRLTEASGLFLGVLASVVPLYLSYAGPPPTSSSLVYTILSVAMLAALLSS